MTRPRFTGSSTRQLPTPGAGIGTGRAVLRSGRPHRCSSAAVFPDATAKVGVEIRRFGVADPVGFASARRSWRQMAAQHLPRTDRNLSGLFDMPRPPTFSLEECDLIAGHMLDAGSNLDLRGQA